MSVGIGKTFLLFFFLNFDKFDLCWPLKIILLVSREGGRWKRQDTETADQCTEGGSAVFRGTEWIVYKLDITSIMSFILESLLNLLSCYHLILFLSIFLLLMTLAALNWCTNSTLNLFDFMQDAVAEHKQELQKKKDEIERLKKGITVPDVESKVSVVWLEF